MHLYSKHVELLGWVEPVFGIGFVFTQRGFNALLGPFNLSFKIYTTADLQRRAATLAILSEHPSWE